jgi:hypothetical protein
VSGTPRVEKSSNPTTAPVRGTVVGEDYAYFIRIKN